jgi:hypothetical protein
MFVRAPWFSSQKQKKSPVADRPPGDLVFLEHSLSDGSA